MGKLKENLNYLIYIIMFAVGWILSKIPIIGVLGVIIVSVASVYQMYIFCESIYNLNMSCGLKEKGDTSRRSPNFVFYTICNTFSLGIYGMWWVYTQRERMTEAANRYRVLNQFTDKDKKTPYFIIGGMIGYIIVICISLGIKIKMMVDVYNNISALFNFNFSSGSSMVGYTIANVFLIIFEFLFLALIMIGWYCYYNDLNILSVAFNKASQDGNRIICMDNFLSGSEQCSVLPLPAVPQGGVRVVSGQYAGSVIQLRENESIVIGRDTAKCDLICNSEKVSRVHLSVVYRPVHMQRNQSGVTSVGDYVVKDMSSNGTSSSTTGVLPKNQEVRQVAGTVLTLGNSSESIRLL